MSFAEVRDYAMWVDQIYGNDALIRQIESMTPGEQIDLEVDGLRSAWTRVSGKLDGRQRAGLKPHGEAQQRWLLMRDEKYAGIASVRLCATDAG